MVNPRSPSSGYSGPKLPEFLLISFGPGAALFNPALRSPKKRDEIQKVPPLIVMSSLMGNCFLLS